jgi:molybdopterin-containing oxidoreductase family iron-sulfur binding subunit
MARFGHRTSQSDPAAPANTGPLSRRIFLKVAVAAGAGVGAVAASAAMAQQDGAHATTETPATHRWAFVIDLRRCDGCAKCTKACQKSHALIKEQTWIKVYEMDGHASGRKYFMPRPCMQCENPPCVRVCPVRATYRNNEGVVLVNQNTCIGCRTCMAACPYEARYFNWNDPPAAPNLLAQPMPEFPVPQQKGTVGKCILCVHNIDVGKMPYCVEACTMEALYIGDMATDVATNGRETVKLSKFLRDNDAVRFREELGTRPRVWYILGHGQNLTF